MKKICAFLVATLIMLSFCLTATAATPVAISSESDLKAINARGNYYLAKDITLSEGFTPLKTFSGDFDGRGKKIINLSIDEKAQIDESVYVGLFEKLDGGTIKNLTLENVEISVSGGKNVYVGAVCAKNVSGTVSNCRVNGKINVSAENANVYVGGIVGQSTAEINLCENSSEITVNASCAVVGGIVGDQGSYYVLEKCINFGEVNVKGVADINCLGGIAGRSANTVENCANYGRLKLIALGNGYVGGIAADVSKNKNGEVKNCFSGGTVDCEAKTDKFIDPIVAAHNNKFSNNFYFDKVISDVSTAEIKTAAALDNKSVSNLSVFGGFDFNSVWKMGENGPVLNCITAAAFKTDYPKQETSSNNSVVTSSSDIETSSDLQEESQENSGFTDTSKPESNSQVNSYPDKVEKENVPPIWIFIVISVVALLGAGVFTFFYLKRKTR